jgi:hypothetical protein
MKARTQNWFPRQCLSTYRKCKLVESEKANAFHTFEAQSPNTQKKLFCIISGKGVQPFQINATMLFLNPFKKCLQSIVVP